jgi:hypothetical protein
MQCILKPAIAIAIMTIVSCNDQTKPGETVANEKTGTVATGQPVFDKLTGTWKSADGKSFERWTKLKNGNYTSVAFSVKGNDTSWNEHASIYPENGQWVFENTVRNQNEGKSVKFISSILNDNAVQFSNPAHDFPTDVHYTVADANTVNAFIIGPNSKGGKDTIPFNYTREAVSY